jgi:redox-sensitive bicupin YhaK (pirin superfamily)
MSIYRAIRASFLAVEKREGIGGRVRRAIGVPKLRNLSPFVLLDQFIIPPGAGFPEHPHRGQETITYILQGSLDHEDFTGNAGTIKTGDLQFMTAGRGIMHAEIPRPTADGSATIGLQLWVDLPRQLKNVEPRYRDLRASEIPTVVVDDGKVAVKVISGKSYGVDSVKDLAYTPVWILDVEIKPGGTFSQVIPDAWNAFTYTLDGTTNFVSSGEVLPIEQYHTVVFETTGRSVSARVPPDEKEGSRFSESLWLACFKYLSHVLILLLTSSNCGCAIGSRNCSIWPVRGQFSE